MSRVTNIIKGLAALAGIAALLVAVPYLLWRFGGTPGVDVIGSLSDPLASDNTQTETILAGMLLIVSWLCWAQVAYALVTELLAALRGRAARTVPLLPGIRTAAARLVATATLTFSTLTPAVAFAAPLQTVGTYEAPAPITETIGLATADGSTTLTASKKTTTYTVGERETFWSIAETTLGDGLRWHEIRDQNIGSTMPDGSTISPTTESVQSGWELQLPEDAVVPTSDDQATASTMANDAELEAMIEVHEGDHFWALAEETLASEWGRTPTDAEISPYWADLVSLNDGRLMPPEDADLIYPGQRFELPPIPTDPTGPPVTPPPETIEEPVPSTAPPSTSPPITTTAPPTTIPTATTAAPTPTAQAVAPDEGEMLDRETLIAAAVGVGTLAVGAGAVALTLRRRRSHQAAKREPRTTIEPPQPEASEYEKRIRPVADTEAARWIDATNKFLSKRLNERPESALPAVIAMRAGRFGVEVLLDDACQPIDGFIAHNKDNTAWRIHPDLQLREVETETVGVQPYCPALVAVGGTEAGDLLLDFEQLAGVSIDGEPELVTGWLRSLATGIAANPWSQFCETIAIGLPDDFAHIDRVTVPDDYDDWASQTSKAMDKLQERLQASPYEQRVNPGEIFHPTVVLIGPGHEELARDLTAKAHKVNTPLAVLAASALPDAERIHLDPKLATLEPAGVDFVPIITEPAEAAAITELLNNAANFETVPVEEPDVADGKADADVDCAEVESVEDVIARVTAPRPIEVKILASMPTAEGLTDRSATKQLSVICYLAFHRQVASTRLRETFWPDAKARSTPDNAISQVRKLLGDGDDGESRLTQAINNGVYVLSDEVGCDWTRASELIDAARNRADTEAIQLLRASLELVSGTPGRDAPPRQFCWLVDDHTTYSEIETTLIDAANRMGELALTVEDHETAAWAADQGLAIVEGSEAMYRLQMRVAAAAGTSRGVQTAYNEAQRAAAEIGPWVEVDEATDELFDDLSGPHEAQAS